MKYPEDFIDKVVVGDCIEVMKRNQKPCTKCGKPMHRQSPRCRACWLAANVKPENYLSLSCQKCGQTFRVHRSQTERDQGKYCSRSCARSGSPTRKRTILTVNCRTCDSKFQKHASEIRKNTGTFHFCSPNCWYAHNQKTNHYLWSGGQHLRLCPDGRRWRIAVLMRDKGFCRLCHVQDRLEAHHIYPFSTHPGKRWNLDNGITLCRDCHRLFRGVELNYVKELSFIAGIPVMVWPMRAVA